MKKAFVSVLGTNNYLECRHSYKNIVTEFPVKYCQEDMIKLFCKDFDEESEIRILLTDDAEKKNWLDNGHLGIDKNPIQNKGLKKRLEELSLSASIKPISIKEGFSETEIWDIFQVIFDSFREGEEVVVDVTHSFRSLPMLMITLLNYAKQIKRIKISGIYYAAFESLGPIFEVNKIPPGERITPILNLTSFVDLQDWTNATYDFINNASVDNMNKLVKLSIKNSQIADPRQKYFPAKVIDKLNELIDNIALCRGNELINFDYQSLKNDINQLKIRELPKAFNFLIDEITKKISDFENDIEKLTIAVVDWCLKHNFIQQAITLLQEFTITFILSKNNLNVSDKLNRELVSQSFNILSLKLPEERWKAPASENNQLVYQLINSDIVKKLFSLFNSLTALRNDVNHGGFLSDSRSNQSIKSRLKEIFNLYKEQFS